MAITDPKRLMLVLEDLLQELRSWSTLAGDVLDLGIYEQRQLNERFVQTSRQARIVNTRMLDDEKLYSSRREDVSTLIGQCEDAVQASKKALSELDVVYERASKNEAEWQNQLNRARNWLDKAERRVASAQSELSKAEQAQRDAERDLRNARADLKRCKSNPQKPNCSRFERAVRDAEQKVSSAGSRVDRATDELNAAKTERTGASTRVLCCERAVTAAAQALGKAKKAQTLGVDALSTAERSLEHALAADRSLEQIREKVEVGKVEVDQMLVDVDAAEKAVEESHSHLRNTMKYEETAQRYYTMARSEIGHRLGLLKGFNLPDLVDLAAYSMSGAADLPGSNLIDAIPTSTESEALAEDAEWVEEMVNFPLYKLPLIENIRDKYDFPDDMPMNVMQDLLRRLALMRPAIDSGEGNNAAFWSQRDKAEGLDSKNGYRHTYEFFYRDKAVHVTQNEEGYTIDRGQHQVWLARQMGFSSLPLILKKPRPYIPEKKVTDSQGKNWQFKTFEEDNLLKIRVYDSAQHPRLPNTVDEGDAGYIDVELQDDYGTIRAKLLRLNVQQSDRERGLHNMLLEQAERACRARGATSMYFVIPRHVNQRAIEREWYRQHQYIFRREERQTMAYKNLSLDE